MSLSFADGEHDPVRGKDPSEWVVMARQSPAFEVLAQKPRWRLLEGTSRSRTRGLTISQISCASSGGIDGSKGRSDLTALTFLLLSLVMVKTLQ